MMDINPFTPRDGNDDAAAPWGLVIVDVRQLERHYSIQSLVM